MDLGKRFSIGLYKQLRARWNLISLNDRRAFKPILGNHLFEAAITWPWILPRKWKPCTIIDVGAHRGEIATQLAEIYHPEFMGLVEPLPQMAVLLQAQSFALQ